jgi:hypothetical protein
MLGHAALGSVDGVRRTLAAITERLAEIDVRLDGNERIAGDLCRRVRLVVCRASDRRTARIGLRVTAGQRRRCFGLLCAVDRGRPAGAADDRGRVLAARSGPGVPVIVDPTYTAMATGTTCVLSDSTADYSAWDDSDEYPCTGQVARVAGGPGAGGARRLPVECWLNSTRGSRRSTRSVGLPARTRHTSDHGQ